MQIVWFKQSSSYLLMTSSTLFENNNIKTPSQAKIIPKEIKIVVVLIIDGTGLHPGNFCCLNFEFFKLSYSSYSASSCFDIL